MLIESLLDSFPHDRSPRPRLIAANTIEFSRNGCRVIRFYATDILAWSRDGRDCTIRAGGKQTATTRERINRYAPVRIFAERGLWFVHGAENSVAPFVDGMTVRDGVAT